MSPRFLRSSDKLSLSVTVFCSPVQFNNSTILIVQRNNPPCAQILCLCGVLNPVSHLWSNTKFNPTVFSKHTFCICSVTGYLVTFNQMHRFQCDGCSPFEFSSSWLLLISSFSAGWFCVETNGSLTVTLVAEQLSEYFLANFFLCFLTFDLLRFSLIECFLNFDISTTHVIECRSGLAISAKCLTGNKCRSVLCLSTCDFYCICHSNFLLLVCSLTTVRRQNSHFFAYIFSLPTPARPLVS